MAIVVEMVSRSGTIVSIDRFDENQVTVGRGFENRVILHDVHVDASHLTISRDPHTGSLSCHDMNSTNGTWLAEVNRKGGIHKRGRQINGVARFYSGQTFQIGKSYVRVYDSRHQVAATRLLSPWEETAHKLDHWWLWLSLSIVLVTLQVWNSFLSIPTSESLSQYFLKACYPILGAVVYAGVFAFLGKNYKHDAKLGSHFSIAVAVILALSVMDFVSPYASYWFAVSELKGLTSELIWMLLLFGGGYMSLALATPLKRGARTIAALVIPATLLISLLIGLLAQPEFKSFAPYDVNLVEPGWQWRDGESRDVFMQKIEGLYHEAETNEAD